MGVIKVETFDVDVSSNGQTLTLDNPLPSLEYGFVRNTNVRGHSGGPVGNTNTAGPDDMSGYARVNSTTQLEFGRELGTVKMMGEVWRYTGPSGGADEFIVRDRLAITLTNAGPSTGNTVSGIVDRNKCVCFITGKTCTQTTQNNMAEMGANAYLDVNGDLTVERGTGTSTLVVYVTVVEFTGVNWTVGYSKFGWGTGLRNVYLDSRGTTGTSATIDWDTSMIIEARQAGGDGANDAIQDMSFLASAGGVSTVDVAIDPGSANTGDGFIHILQHPGLLIGRTTASKSISNNNSYVNEEFPLITLTALDEAAVEWTATTDGAGTAHGRGSLNARLTALTTLQSWVHRSGNGGTYRYGVVDLSNLNNTVTLIIDNVDTDDIVGNIQTGVIISGTEFGTSQGTGTVILSENIDGTGTTVSQTVTNWTDTAVTVNISAGALFDTNCFLILTNDDGAQGTIAIQVGIPPLTYTEVVESLFPDHYWPLDGDYVDTIQALNWTNFIGSPTFAEVPLTRGRTNSWRVNSTGQEGGPDNSDFMNQQTETTRTMGGWIRITEVQDSFVMFYEEGGGVNNLAFFMGIGGILIAQFADTGDDNVHAYSDFPLAPNRNYHIMFRFDYNQPAQNRRFELLIDGVLQTNTFGNPLLSTDLDAHSGDIRWGDSADNLEVFGTDINFPAAITTYFQDWATWTDYLTEIDIRTSLFEQGVRGEHIITVGTEAEMQLQIDAFANTVQPNSDCTFIIQVCIDGDFTLSFDNITFNNRTSIHVQYIGVSTLTIINLNGSNTNSNNISVINGGIVVIQTPFIVTFTNLKPNSEVRIYEAGTMNEVAGIELTGTSWSTSVTTSPIDYVIHSLGFIYIRQTNIPITSNRTIPIQQQIDRFYINP